jgi:hypothetical protein
LRRPQEPANGESVEVGLERLTAEVSLNFVAVVFLLIGAVLFIVAEWID